MLYSWGNLVATLIFLPSLRRYILIFASEILPNYKKIPQYFTTNFIFYDLRQSAKFQNTRRKATMQCSSHQSLVFGIDFS